MTTNDVNPYAPSAFDGVAVTETIDPVEGELASLGLLKLRYWDFPREMATRRVSEGFFDIDNTSVFPRLRIGL